MYKSKVIFGSLGPVWDEEVALSVSPEDRYLHLTVKDFDKARKNEKLGVAAVPLFSLPVPGI